MLIYGGAKPVAPHDMLRNTMSAQKASRHTPSGVINRGFSA
ncbi:hypothetical protein A11S_110 [Micavibrio aeruginosavorus EPB]|uniref:Uncharacterized protein n=1 Tax=Micavibrio aeruginosavorus EPB TaxID=349215 RepID=M4VC21_9BACT|nr:hypothetical protein A11S_110 [Micavibrio aeruginosavorus EPB]